MGRVSGIEADIEANLILIEVEAYDAAIGQEVCGFAHSENGQTAKGLQDCGLAPLFVEAEEKNIASLKVLRTAERANMEDPVSDGLALDGGLQFLASRLIREDAEIESRILGAEGAARPSHKLRKVKQKRSFDLVLIGRGLGACNWRCP